MVEGTHFSVRVNGWWFVVLTTLVCFLDSASALAQYSRLRDYPLEETWRWIRFTTTAGLPSDHILDVADDGNDIPWVCTTKGVAWFDGFRWHPVGGLDPQGSIEYAKFHGVVNGVFLLSIDNAPYAVSPSGVRRIGCPASESDIVVQGDTVLSFRNHTIYRWQPGAGGETPLISFPASRKISLYCATRRHLLFREWNTLWSVRGSEKRKVLHSSESLLGITSVYSYPGEILFYVYLPWKYVGIWSYAEGHGTAKRVLRTSAKPLQGTIAEDGDACFVFEEHLYISRTRGRWSTLRALPEHIPAATSLRYRRNRDLWYGTEQGLYLCRRGSSPCQLVQWPRGDARNRVNDILLRKEDGSIWLATSGGLVHIPVAGAMRTYSALLGRKLGIVTGIEEDQDGTLWICSGSSFAGLYRRHRGVWKGVPVERNGGGVYIHRMFHDRQRRMWFPAIHATDARDDSVRAGVFLRTTSGATLWRHSGGLPDQRVYAVHQSLDSTLWFGTWNGIAAWKNGKWRYFGRNKKPYPMKAVSLTSDSLGRVYAGFGKYRTGRLGIGVVDGTSMRYVTTADGLPSNDVWEVLTDDRGRIWASTQGGLACLHQGAWLDFSLGTGLPTCGIWPIAVRGDSLFVGTAGNGLAILRISKLLLPPPRISIHAPLVRDRKAVVSWTGHSWWGSVSPEHLQTRYRTDRAAWSAWSVEHRVQLTNLPQGWHVLQVQAKGYEGRFDPSGSSVTFQILPPIHLRWYVLLPAVCVLGAFILLVVVFLRRRIEFHRAIRKSEERYKIITELMSDYAFLYSVRADGLLMLEWITPSIERIIGCSSVESRDLARFAQLVHNEDVATFWRLWEVARVGMDSEAVYRIHIPGAAMRWVETVLSPVCDETNGRVVQIYGVTRDITDRQSRQERMKRLASDLVSTEERERARMARQVHDGLGQILALAFMKLRSMHRAASPASSTVSEVEQLLEHAIRDTHTLTFELCPPVVLESDLAQALRWLTGNLQGIHQCTLRNNLDENCIRLAPDIHTYVFRSMRELIINAMKHAAAEHIAITIDLDDSMLTLEVLDDGVGFPAAVLDRLQRNGLSAISSQMDSSPIGFGLPDMKARLGDFGITMEIASHAGKGSSVTLRIPPGAFTISDVSLG